MFKVILLLPCLLFLMACQKQEHLDKNSNTESPSYYGITIGPTTHWNIPPAFINQVMDDFDTTNLTHVVIYPLGYINRHTNSNALEIENDNSAWVYQAQQSPAIMTRIQAAQSRNFKVVLKPHIYFSDETYTGHFKVSQEADWQIFEQNYSNYIHKYAQMAASMQVDFFCVGTEVDEFVLQRPHFWEHLIDSIKTYYSGKIIYAANWDRYEQLSIWEHTDYIGIDAYFPLSDAQLPSVEALCTAWEQRHLPKMKQTSEQHQKKIIFTEIGYRSIDHCAKSPWDYWSMPSIPITADNLLIQQNQFNALKAALDVFEHTDYIDGFFFWEMIGRYVQNDVTYYSIKNKLADTLLTNSFRRIKNK